MRAQCFNELIHSEIAFNRGYNALPFQNIVRHQALNPFNP